MKKKHTNNPPKPKEFAATPFAALKGVQAAPSPAVKPVVAPVAAMPVDRDDTDLFLRAMEDVQRLHVARRPPAVSKSESLPQEKPRTRRLDEGEMQLFREALSQLHLDKTFVDEIPDDEATIRPMPVNRMRQLRRGSIRIDYELDLHGLTRDEALDALEHFVAGAWRRGQQAVLVITGQGNNSPGEPVLQGAVQSWLRTDGQAIVAEFAVAPSQLGGSGAFVVFLKKKKEGDV